MITVTKEVTAVANTDTLDTLESLASGLIRDEVRAAESRHALERAAVQAILRDGHTIDDVSAATGLAPREIKRALEYIPPMDEDLGELFGLPAFMAPVTMVPSSSRS